MNEEEQPKLRGFARLSPERRKESGRLGGIHTRDRQTINNPDYYSNIGRKGGQSMLEKYGVEFLRKIGSSPKTRQKKEAQ